MDSSTDDEIRKMLDEIDTDIKRNKKTKKKETKKKETKKKETKTQLELLQEDLLDSDGELKDFKESDNEEVKKKIKDDFEKEFEALFYDTEASEKERIEEEEIRKILFGSETETEPVDIAEKIADKVGEENVISLMSLEGEELQEVIDNAIKERNKLRNQPSKKTFKERKERAKQRRERAKQLSYIDATEGVITKEGEDLYSAYPEEEFDEAKDLLKQYKEDFMFEKEKLKNMEKKSEKYKKQNFKLIRLKNIYDLQKEKVEAMKNLQKNIPYEFRGTPLSKKNNK